VVEVPAQVQATAPERQGVASGGLFCRRAAVYHAAAKTSSWYTNQIRNTRLVDAKATRHRGRGYAARLVAAWPCFCRKRYAQTTRVRSAPHRRGRPGLACGAPPTAQIPNMYPGADSVLAMAIM